LAMGADFAASLLQPALMGSKNKTISRIERMAGLGKKGSRNSEDIDITTRKPPIYSIDLRQIITFSVRTPLGVELRLLNTTSFCPPRSRALVRWRNAAGFRAASPGAAPARAARPRRSAASGSRF